MTDDVCPYCMAETMRETIDAWGGVVVQCLDCGYTREREPDTEDEQESAA